MQSPVTNGIMALIMGGEFWKTSPQYTGTSIKSFGLCEKSADWIFQKFRLERNSFWEAYKKIVLYLFEIPHKSPHYLLCSNDKLNLTIPPFADTFTFIFPFPSLKCSRITHSKCDLDFITKCVISIDVCFIKHLLSECSQFLIFPRALFISQPRINIVSAGLIITRINSPAECLYFES